MFTRSHFTDGNSRQFHGRNPVLNRCAFSLAAILLLGITSIATAGAGNHGQPVRTWQIEGRATTGPNDICGVPQWKLPEPFGPAHFTFLGEYNPQTGASDAIKLSAANCDPGILLATTVDPNFQAFFGFPDPDPQLKNLPLRQVWTVAGLDGVRSPLPVFGTVPPNPLPPTGNFSNKPITLGDWLKAKAKLKIRCLQDGGAKVEASFNRLVPNGLYGMYGIWKTKLPGSTQPTFLPVAFGGFPHLVTANGKGEADFIRQLNYCPKDPTPDGSVLMLIDLAYHADGISHGAFPFTPAGAVQFRAADGSVFESTEPPGTVTHVQIGFPVNVKELD